jgi:hypothetical protein
MNHIYHILTDRRQATSIINVRTYRGSNYDSGHYLVEGMYRARIKNGSSITGRNKRKSILNSYERTASGMNIGRR